MTYYDNGRMKLMQNNFICLETRLLARFPGYLTNSITYGTYIELQSLPHSARQLLQLLLTLLVAAMLPVECFNAGACAFSSLERVILTSQNTPP